MLGFTTKLLSKRQTLMTNIKYSYVRIITREKQNCLPKNHFETLGVSRDASKEQISQAFSQALTKFQKENPIDKSRIVTMHYAKTIDDVRNSRGRNRSVKPQNHQNVIFMTPQVMHVLEAFRVLWNPEFKERYLEGLVKLEKKRKQQELLKEKEEERKRKLEQKKRNPKKPFDFKDFNANMMLWMMFPFWFTPKQEQPIQYQADILSDEHYNNLIKDLNEDFSQSGPSIFQAMSGSSGMDNDGNDSGFDGGFDGGFDF